MEEYIHNLTFQVITALNSSELENINGLLHSRQGISNIKCTELLISLDYNSYVVAEDDILKLLSTCGIATTSPKKEGFLRHWLKELEKENKETFGKKRLDCCNQNMKNI